MQIRLWKLPSHVPVCLRHCHYLGPTIFRLRSNRDVGDYAKYHELVESALNNSKSHQQSITNLYLGFVKYRFLTVELMLMLMCLGAYAIHTFHRSCHFVIWFILVIWICNIICWFSKFVCNVTEVKMTMCILWLKIKTCCIAHKDATLSIEVKVPKEA